MNDNKLRKLLDSAKPIAEDKIKEKAEQDREKLIREDEKERREANSHLTQALIKKDALTTSVLKAIIDTYFETREQALNSYDDVPESVTIVHRMSIHPESKKILKCFRGLVHELEQKEKYDFNISFQGKMLVRTILDKEKQGALFDIDYFRKLGFDFKIANNVNAAVIVPFEQLEEFVKKYLNEEIENNYISISDMADYRKKLDTLDKKQKRIELFLKRCDYGLETTILDITNRLIRVMDQTKGYSEKGYYEVHIPFYMTTNTHSVCHSHYSTNVGEFDNSGAESYLESKVGKRDLTTSKWICENTNLEDRICFVPFTKGNETKYMPVLYEQLVNMLQKLDFEYQAMSSLGGKEKRIIDWLEIKVMSKAFIEWITGKEKEKQKKENGTK